MKTVHLIKNGLNGCTISAVAVEFDEENQYIKTSKIEYEQEATAQDILDVLGIENAEIWETHIRGGGIKKKR